VLCKGNAKVGVIPNQSFGTYPERLLPAYGAHTVHMVHEYAGLAGLTGTLHRDWGREATADGMAKLCAQYGGRFGPSVQVTALR
jgi:hypothetical protein